MDDFQKLEAMFKAAKLASRDKDPGIVVDSLAGDEGTWRVFMMAGWDEGDGVVYWTLSAVLEPFGRCSTEKDWNLLGQYTGHLQVLAGTEPVLLTPLDETLPNAPHFWCWREDGKPLTPELIKGAKQRIAERTGS